MRYVITRQHPAADGGYPPDGIVRDVGIVEWYDDSGWYAGRRLPRGKTCDHANERRQWFTKPDLAAALEYVATNPFVD